MPTLKEFNVKLARLRSTRKITKTMKLVSANKLRRSQEAQATAGSFASGLDRIMVQLAGVGPAERHALFKAPPAVRHVLVVIFTSDRGLCGGFNSGLIRHVVQWRAAAMAAGRKVTLSCCGRRGWNYFRTRGDVWEHYEDGSARPRFALALQMGKELQSSFVTGRFDEVHVAYNAARGGLAYEPTIERLLPIDPASLPRATGPTGRCDCLYEPAPAALLPLLLPRWVNLRVYQTLLSTATGEHRARMAAMDQATSNADTLIQSLTLQRNRARQAAITTELIEIVAGAEALK